MSISDIPQIPREYKPRVQKLYNKIKAKEITVEEITNNILTILGKTTIYSGGIKISGNYGSFEIDSRMLTSGMEASMNLLDILPIFFGKKFLTKKGNELTLVKIGFGLKRKPATEKHLKDKSLPIIEYDTETVEADITKTVMNILSMYLQENTDPEPAHPLFKIHRLEEFSGWFGKGWKQPVKIYKMSMFFSQLTTKEILDKLGESMAPFCDQVLKKCGV